MSLSFVYELHFLFPRTPRYSNDVKFLSLRMLYQ